MLNSAAWYDNLWTSEIMKFEIGDNPIAVLIVLLHYMLYILMLEITYEIFCGIHQCEP